MDVWFYELMGEAIGPVDFRNLQELVRNGSITPDTNVRHGTDGAWKMAGIVEGILSDDQLRLIAEAHARREKQAARHRIPIVTTPDYAQPGFVLARTFNSISAVRVAGINVLKDIAVQARDFFGGRSKTIESTLEQMEHDVRDELVKKAAERNANAIISYISQPQIIDRGASGGVILIVSGSGTPAIYDHTTESTK